MPKPFRRVFGIGLLLGTAIFTLTDSVDGLPFIVMFAMGFLSASLVLL